ncbi:universal stress protein [Natrinema sp. SYSU A 869]|uniref:universal stress protein n=1 Tax=Natrinema sp. SYSU A 869 TaxID=2871694 RepID=UPI001CA3A96F|nr:universal stress protein [Natrinema sp. SYSU A 869]
MFETILVPVDGSDSAKRAAAVGREFAEQYNARLDMLHVLEDQSRLPGSESDQTSEEKGREILDKHADLVTGSNIEIDTRLVDGQPHEAITEHATETASDLIVMGRHGQSGLRERLLGTVTDRVLRHTSIPVLVVPGEVSDHTTGNAYENVLITTDGSENAEQAAPYGEDIVQQFKATLHLLTVVDVQAAAGAFDAGGVSEDFTERLEDDGHEAIERLARQIEDTDLPLESAVLRGDAQEVIVDYTVENDIGLIVMASEGESNLASQSLGSVTDRVLRTVDIPVLVVFR